jgi:hypothetical protein
MGAQELYSPLQELLRKFSVREALEVIWSYTQFLQFDIPLSPEIEVDDSCISKKRLGNKFFEWELELLAREIIINSSSGGSLSLKSWAHFAEAINLIKEIENQIAAHKDYRELFRQNITLELYRIAHRQFPWQRRIGTNLLVRYFKIFSHPVLDQILQRKLNLSARELYIIGLIISGLFLSQPTARVPIPSAIPAIKNEKIVQFLKIFSDHYASLKERIEAAQSLDQDFAYTLNPLKLSPIIRFGGMSNGEIMCPLPTNLIRRFTEGVYYEVYNEPEFANAFGDAFQKHVGEVIAILNSRQTLLVFSEEIYRVGKNQKHTIDWIIRDSSGSLFIECKTKKVRWASKIALASMDALNEDLDKLSDFVVQAYKTLIDALEKNYPTWKPDEKPIYILILTLEEWYSFGDRVFPPLHAKVLDKLKNEGLDIGLCTRFPYFVASLNELEMMLQIISEVSIQRFFSEKHDKRYSEWGFDAFMHELFADQLRGRKLDLFPQAMDDLTSGIE